MDLLKDPKIFNYVILCLYALNACRWAYAKSWGDFFYWLSAFGITTSVTWEMKRG